jgi:dual specificity phosphatase 12
VLIVAKLPIPPNLVDKFQPCKVAFIDAIDSEEQNLLSHFDTTYKFINEGIMQGQGVVVACEAGISRSCTIVAAYLMKENDLDAYDALDMIKKQRKLAHPNPGFFEQLQLYERLGCTVNNMDHETQLKMSKYPFKATFDESR